MKSILSGILVLSSLLFAGMATAGDSEAGKTKAITCTGCHGIANYTNVYPTYKVPKIAGQNAKYLEAALRAYKNGERKHPTMLAQTASLSDTDIADISAWLAGLK